jgi:hypothetical protein
MRNKNTHRHKTESWGWEEWVLLVGYVSTYLSQSIYFIGQYKKKTQVKIKLQQFLGLSKRNEFCWANFSRAMEA